jgi:4-diphosphocytidyl-2C-methyl-D-erythritol kinase
VKRPTQTSATFKAPAKLNLLLGVSPRIVEGKHQLITVFTTIDLADTLSFTFDPTRERLVTVEVVCAQGVPALDLPLERNIVYRAVLALEQACGRKLNGWLDIAIDKHIPSEGGLAGGSSDAAATLRMLAGLWGIDPLGEPVLNVAKSLGADVAFFLYGGCALMGGAGEKLLRRLSQPTLHLVLVKPAGGVATAAAYAAFDACPQPQPSADRLVQLLESAEATGAPNTCDVTEASGAQDARVAPLPGVVPASGVAPAPATELAPTTPPAAPATATLVPPTPSLVSAIAQELANNLSPAACALMPELKTLIAEVGAQPGVHAALLTGSGSTVFGVCASALAAQAAAKHFATQGYWAKACATTADA